MFLRILKDLTLAIAVGAANRLYYETVKYTKSQLNDPYRWGEFTSEDVV